MFYATKQNKYIVEGTAFELDGVQYPAVWLNQATAEQKAAVGLVEVVVVGEKRDDRYYWISETLEAGVLTYANVPKDLDSLKVSAKAAINDTIWKTLLPTDFMDSRPNYTPPADWMAWRDAVRATGTSAKVAVDAATDVDALITAAYVEWPHDPNYVAPAVEVM